MKVDVILGLQWGDEGKGKIAVSYTHLDVYKRQVFRKSGNKALFVQPEKEAPVVFCALTSIKLIMLIMSIMLI